MRYRENEDGQAIILVVLAMGIFLLGAVGLGFDGSVLYSTNRSAQLAADAAAQAAMLSIFDGTNALSTNAAKFSTSASFTCTTTDARTPCKYASINGFGTSSDTVKVDFPTTATGVSLSAEYPTNLVKVTITRNVTTTFMRLLGPSSTTVGATATAAIVDVNAPVPILVIHPSSTKKLPSPFSVQGTPNIQICGGPSRSIQVNSNSGTAANSGGSATVDLSKAGPNDTHGDCTTGTGADLGVWGGPSSLKGVSYGTTGRYVYPASWMQDPLQNVSAPDIPTVGGVKGGTQLIGTQTTMTAGTTNAAGITCPSSTSPHGCTLLTPGLYSSGLNLTTTYAMFMPGIYYMQGSKGFQCAAGCSAVMVKGIPDGSCSTCSGTGWDGASSATGGMLVYNTGTGQFNVGASGSASLIGSPPTSSYKGILFFEDRAAAANNVDQSPQNAHTLGGGGDLTLIGTIYLTNTRSTILGSTTTYQELDLKGNSGNTTKIQGEIIVDALQLGGTGGITMNLNSNASYIVSEIALVE